LQLSRLIADEEAFGGDDFEFDCICHLKIHFTTEALRHGGVQILWFFAIW
jgi:hypothetical protein